MRTVDLLLLAMASTVSPIVSADAIVLSIPRPIIVTAEAREFGTTKLDTAKVEKSVYLVQADYDFTSQVPQSQKTIYLDGQGNVPVKGALVFLTEVPGTLVFRSEANGSVLSKTAAVLKAASGAKTTFVYPMEEHYDLTGGFKEAWNGDTDLETPLRKRLSDIPLPYQLSLRPDEGNLMNCRTAYLALKGVPDNVVAEIGLRFVWPQAKDDKGARSISVQFAIRERRIKSEEWHYAGEVSSETRKIGYTYSAGFLQEIRASLEKKENSQK